MSKLNTWLEQFQQKTTKLSALEKFSIRLGWLGTGLIIVAPHLLPSTMGIVLYIISGILLTPQVVVSKQWNLLIININVIVAYTLLFLK